MKHYYLEVSSKERGFRKWVSNTWLNIDGKITSLSFDEDLGSAIPMKKSDVNKAIAWLDEGIKVGEVPADTKYEVRDDV